MDQYVCVRIPRMDDVDIGLFDYDRYNTLYFFVLNEDEQIYLRYGGRDGASQDTFLSLDSLELALQKGLELHQQYRKGELKKTARPAPFFPRQIPPLVERTYARGNCVECHLIGDYQNVQREQEGTLDKIAHMYRSPDLRTIGIFFDIPKGLIVKESREMAAAAGIRPGDRIAAVNGTTVWTFGDLQYFYDKVDRKAKSVNFRVIRDEKSLDLTVNLPIRWWWTDVRFRQLSIDPRTYFESRPLTESEKKERNLPLDGFASMVTHVDSFAQMMKSHDLRKGDVVFSVDGAEKDEIANTAEFYIKLRKTAGDSVTLGVLRDSQKIEMPLKTFRMSFRK